MKKSQSKSSNKAKPNRSDSSKPKPQELPLVLESPPEMHRATQPQSKFEDSCEKFIIHDEFDIIAYQADHPNANLVRDGAHLIDLADDDILDEDYKE